MRTCLLVLLASTVGCQRGSLIGPSNQPPPIDVLNFIIGDSDLWPRTGDQLQHQTVDWGKREVCWVKYGVASMFECWRWDDAWVYHAVDHGVDGNTGESYTFTDGRWLPRYLSGPWTLDVSENRLHWFSRDCDQVWQSSRHAPYRQHAELVGSQFVSADLGTRNVLVLEYEGYSQYGLITSPLERFYFAEGAGWYYWEADRGARRFDVIGGPAVARGPACDE